MSTLLSYSGIATKIRAMESYLITDEGYRTIADFTSVHEVISYLQEIPGYRDVFAHMEESQLHRGELEKHMYESIYWGFVRLYRFANQEQRKFLDLYFKRYELFVIKRYLHCVEDHRTYIPFFGTVDAFFRRHTQLDLERLSSSGSVEEVIQNLEGTEYFQPLEKIWERGKFSSFQYEMTLDMYYFRQIWKIKDKLFKGTELDSLTEAYGTKFDLLNLDWIYRSKKYYHLSSGEIYALMLPVHYRLKASEITSLVEANSMDEFAARMEAGYYAKKFKELKPETIEQMYAEIMKAILRKESRNHPYSVVSIYSYLYQKEHEIDRLTTALECIRYGLDARTTYEYIMRS